MGLDAGGGCAGEEVGGETGCFGYWRRETAWAADLAGLEDEAPMGSGGFEIADLGVELGFSTDVLEA